MIKRIFDVIVAITASIVLSPLIAALCVRLSIGDGGIFFRQRRVGLSGNSFYVFKFRTMVFNADKVLEQLLASDESLRFQWESEQKLRVDPRVTSVGRFLRKTSLDELPQLLNVIAGQMSLVGPRPVLPDELARYGRSARHYCSLRPGMTGLWQVSGRNDTSYSRRVALDRYYSINKSWSLDLLILLKTVVVIFKGKGAY